MNSTKSYKIVTSFQKGFTVDGKATVELFVSANMANLATLLQVLDENSTVSELSVYSTFSVPDLCVLSKLTDRDLGITNLKKLK